MRSGAAWLKDAPQTLRGQDQGRLWAGRYVKEASAPGTREGWLDVAGRDQQYAARERTAGEVIDGLEALELGRQPWRIRAFCAWNSASVRTPAALSSPSRVSWASVSSTDGGAAGAACGGGAAGAGAPAG